MESDASGRYRHNASVSLNNASVLTLAVVLIYTSMQYFRLNLQRQVAGNVCLTSIVATEVGSVEQRRQLLRSDGSSAAPNILHMCSNKSI